MFIEGQKVVCIDDQFPNWAVAIYDNLPEKDKTYTVRQVMLGCNPKAVDPASKGLSHPKFIGTQEVTILLVEITNKTHEVSKQEPGFKAERFKPLEDISEEEIMKNKDVINNPKRIKQPKPVLV